ncbi:MAG: DUF1553 domain-containing protein [Verrucomicrobiales bacterium]|nr:DUF1553 domain-containing protein [Verrucomicrobiales bacterium]
MRSTFLIRVWRVLAAGILLAGGLLSAAPGSSEPRSSTNLWWSLQPLRRPPIPKTSRGTRNPVDAFVQAGLDSAGIPPSDEADRRTLIRRLSFDLRGLPPSAAEVDAFLTESDPNAYERLVDRWLASPQYGERWARHWLDVVHYGETHGYDKDQPRPNAWPYRDYVVRAFNQDRPYSRFIEEQIAGDVLFPDSRDGVEALGFVSAGPWDLIGHAEVPETKMDGQVARHLDRDDMVVNTLQTFNSLTVQCAQCHNHKFDPISQEDYYRLQAVFAAVDRADRKYDWDPGVAKTRKEIRDRAQVLMARQRTLDETIRSRAGVTLTNLEQAIASREATMKIGDAYGFHSNIEKKDDVEKWVQVDLGAPVPLANVVLHPCRDDFNGIGNGFGFPVRFRVEVSGEDGFRNPVMIADETRADVPNPGLRPFAAETAGRRVRFIRVTATKLAPRQDDFIFALAEISALTSEGRNAALGAAVASLDSIEAPNRWQRVNLTDGWYPGVASTNDAQVLSLQRQRTELLQASTQESERREIGENSQALASLKETEAHLPAPSTAYVASVYSGSGAFAGTGKGGGKPRTIRVLARGSIQKPGVEVGPGSLRCIPELSGEFSLAPEHREGDRRAALAAWLTDPRNPLTWRSAVNRVWQYHFGRGLVETPNDFGRMGALPSHPELLDWLASEFRDGGQSLKALHRLLVTSATYRQRSEDRPEAAQIDSGNRLWWRMNRRKLEAEAVRDALLMTAERLDLRMGGPSFRDFVVEKPEHSPHYEYGLHNPSDPASQRRSIYRWIVRSQPQPFLTTLDCADPSMQVARRNESTSPLQALAVLNNGLVLSMSREAGAAVAGEGGDLSAQVRRAHQRILGRDPASSEQAALLEYASRFGMTNCCRVLFNLNEFSFVD